MTLAADVYETVAEYRESDLGQIFDLVWQKVRDKDNVGVCHGFTFVNAANLVGVPCCTLSHCPAPACQKQHTAAAGAPAGADAAAAVTEGATPHEECTTCLQRNTSKWCGNPGCYKWGPLRTLPGRVCSACMKLVRLSCDVW